MCFSFLERRALPGLAGVVLTSEGHREIFTRRHRGRLPAEIALVRNVPRRETPEDDGHLRRETGIPDGDRIWASAGARVYSGEIGQYVSSSGTEFERWKGQRALADDQELAGMMVINAYLLSKGEKRSKVLIPDTARRQLLARKNSRILS